MTTIEELYNIYTQHPCITTDTRTIHGGEIFFALKGDNFDGNTFALKAIEQGAAFAVVDNNECYYQNPDKCILVDDVLLALQDLARYHRKMTKHIPVVAITGTNGKTTTKELTTAVLSKKYNTHSTKGNYNNHIGVPLTLLSMPQNTDIAIIEMGANHPKEIEFLCSIAQPNYGLITNIGKAHLEGFGSFENVIKTKTELYNYLRNNDGTAFINSDDNILVENSLNLKHIEYSSHCINTTIRPSYKDSSPYLEFYFEADDKVYTINTHLLGAYNYTNALAAICVAAFFRVDLFDIKMALEEYIPTNHRSQLKKTNCNSLIMDCYNANPSSMKIALENFGAINTQGRKVAILGAMKELGAESEYEHKAIAKLACNIGIDMIVFVGKEFGFVEPQSAILYFDDISKAKEHFNTNRITESIILLKGSNSMHMGDMEEVL